MKSIFLILVAVVALAAGCSGNKAEELFETAKLEELQDNQDHARQLYQEIVRKYPDSQYAKKAGERLSALQESK